MNVDGALRALSGEPAPMLWRAVVWMLAPVALAYSIGLKLYLLTYRLGLRKRARLQAVTVSIGNLSAGGTGKTALTMSLARALLAKGLRVCVLTRGYRGKSEHGQAVVSDGAEVLLDAAQAGDEAALMARELPGVPVLAGRDRRVTGRMAVERFRPDVVLLDDGMQFYQLHRDVEIVMLNAERPFGNGMPMPAGILREPAGHLGRADWAILHRTTGTGAPVASRGGRLRRMAEAGRAATASYRPVAVRELDTGHVGHPSDLKGRRVAVLCALGNPKRFEATVTQLGAEITHASRLPDHAVLSDADLNTAALDAKRTGAEALIVTAKDAVKLAQARPVVPVWVLEAELVVDKMDCIVDAIEDQVRARRAPDAGLLDDAMCCAGPCRGQAEPCEGLP